VDEYALTVRPVILGGGTPFFPDLERPAGLRLLETRTFSSGAVYLGFAAADLGDDRGVQRSADKTLTGLENGVGAPDVQRARDSRGS